MKTYSELTRASSEGEVGVDHEPAPYSARIVVRHKRPKQLVSVGGKVKDKPLPEES